MTKIILTIAQLITKYPTSSMSRTRALKRIIKRLALTIADPVLFNPATQTRIITADALNDTLVLAISRAQTKSTNNVTVKNKSAIAAALIIKQYIGQLQNAFANGILQVGDWGMFKLDSSGNLPKMTTDQDILDVGKNMIDGAAEYHAEGRPDIISPDIIAVKMKHVDLQSWVDLQNTYDGILTTAQTALSDTNVALDSLIIRAWKEIQTYYCELPKETQRAQCRLWGVVYISKKASSVVTALLLNSDRSPNVIATATLEETGAIAKVDDFGVRTLKTGLVGDGVIILEEEGKTSVKIPVILTESSNLNLGTITF